MYREVNRGNPVSLDEFLEGFRRSWDDRWHENVVVVKKNLTTHFYLKRGEECLKQYYDRHKPFDHGCVVGLELTVPITLGVGCDFSFKGVIDRLEEVSPGRFEIHDYKTAGRLPNQSDLNRDKQMGLYQIGVQQMYPQCEEVQVVWHFLVFDKQIRITLTKPKLERVKSEAIQIIKRIEGEIRFPASPGPLCRWCEYVEVCPEGGVSSLQKR